MHEAARPLIIGGTGLLGRALVSRAGPDVVATHHRGSPGPTGTWCPLDLRDGGIEAADLIGRFTPPAVVNAAYVSSGPSLEAVTARAPEAMAAACARLGIRFVHVSSDLVFGGRKAPAYREHDDAVPVNEYGQAKRAAEEAVASANPEAVIVRTSLLWDPAGCPQLDLVADPGVDFYTDEIRCPLRVDRLAAACLELSGRPEIRGLLHVAGADAVDRYTFACLLAPHAGRVPAELRGRSSGRDPGRPGVIVLDSTKARALLTTPLPGVRTDC